MGTKWRLHRAGRARGAHDDRSTGLIQVSMMARRRKTRRKGRFANEEDRLLEAAKRRLRGDLRLKQSDLKGAIEEYRRSVEIDADSLESRLRLADAYFFAEEPSRSVRQYLEALRIAPDSHDAYLGLADALRVTGKPLEALQVLQEGARVAHNRAYFHYVLGECFIRRGRIDDAIEELRLALMLAPQEGFYYFRLARLYFARGRFDAGLLALEGAVQAAPQDDYYRAYLGVAYGMEGRWHEALEQLERAVELNPEQRVYHAILADTCEMSGEEVPASVHANQADALETYDHVLIQQIYTALSPSFDPEIHVAQLCGNGRERGPGRFLNSPAWEEFDEY